MKSHKTTPEETIMGSRPARGAWIEIMEYLIQLGLNARRAPHGARGLKFNKKRSEGKPY